MNAKGTFNHSSLQIIETSELVEPTGWFPGRQYYVVTEGLRIGVFHDLSVTYLLPIYTAYIQGYRSDVRQSVDPLPKLRPLWVTCRTWANAVQTWDMACRNGNVCILRKDGESASATATTRSLPLRRIKPPAADEPVPDNVIALIPLPTLEAPAPHNPAPDNTNTLRPAPTSAAPTSLLPVTKCFPFFVIISDSDSDSNSDSSSSDDSDSDIQSTSTKVTEKGVACCNVANENGGSTSRQTHDATDTHSDAPIKTKGSGNGKTVRFATITSKYPRI